MGHSLFFHIGIERTATTYLQDEVFPHFKNIQYIHKKDYHQFDSLYDTAKHQSCLLSYELNLNEQFERELTAFSARYPQSIPIIVLRKQSDWLRSQFKRHLKNGKGYDFDAFFSLTGSASLFSRDALFFQARMEYLKAHFEKEPIVLFYDDFKRQPKIFIQQFADIIGAKVDWSAISSQKVHVSYTDAQLLALARSMRKYDLKRLDKPEKGVALLKYRLDRWRKDLIRYYTLYSAKYTSSKNKHTPLIPESTLKSIDEFYKADWEACMNDSYKAKY